MEYFGNSWIAAFVVCGLGIVGYIISNLSGGGSLLLAPVVSHLAGARAVAPILNLGELIGEPVRVFLFWKHIRWDITRYYLPAAIAGALAAGFLFKSFDARWLKIIIGLFLVSTMFQYRLGERRASFRMKLWYFAPTGFFVGFFSTLVGALGPILNPFYLNYGVEKEALIGTKTVNSFILDIVQVGLYSTLGFLGGWLWIYGIAIGLGAIAGNIIGKKLLGKITGATFRRFVIAVMVISGIVMIASEVR